MEAAVVSPEEVEVSVVEEEEDNSEEVEEEGKFLSFSFSLGKINLDN